MSPTKEYIDHENNRSKLISNVSKKIEALHAVLRSLMLSVNNENFSHFIRDPQVKEKFDFMLALSDSVDGQVLSLQTTQSIESLHLLLSKFYAYTFKLIDTKTNQDIKTVKDSELLYSLLNDEEISKARHISQLHFDAPSEQDHISKLLDSLISSLKDIVLNSLINFTKISQYRAEINKLKSTVAEFTKSIAKDSAHLKVELQKEREQFKEQMAEEVKNAKEAVEATKRIALEAGISEHFDIFEKGAKKHDSQSLWWLGAVVIIILGAICFVGLLMTDYIVPDYKFQTANTETFKYELAQYVLNKIIIITAIFYGLSICVRNYKAHRHNHVVNKHRQNALSTFQSFSTAATDPQTRNAILLEATHSIFSSHHTGYMGADAESESPYKILEIIKNTGSK